MGLKIGIVGLPNAGKSTLFNALTGAANAAAENFPFCTIEPNVGRVPVWDPRLDQIAQVVNSQKIIPESIEFVDIAGLVAGAAKGEGLGNKFLANIRETDAILIVLRFFDDKNVVHVAGHHDPERDKEILETELILKDMETMQKAVDKASKDARSGDKDKKLFLETMQKILHFLEKGQKANNCPLDDKEALILHSLHLLTSKPFLYTANIAEKELIDFKLEKAKKQIKLNDNEILIPISAKIEAEIAELNKEEKKEFLAGMGLEQSGLEKLAMEAQNILGLSTFFTAGEKEIRAWHYLTGSTAPQTAGKIHTDFEKGFIKADSVSINDFVTCGGWNGAREKGKVTSVGKEHIVQDGEVLLFKFNV